MLCIFICVETPVKSIAILELKHLPGPCDYYLGGNEALAGLCRHLLSERGENSYVETDGYGLIFISVFPLVWLSQGDLATTG